MISNKKFGLAGKKLGHSFSKNIHEALKLYAYDLIECSDDEFDALMKTKAFDGLNITIPYKEKVLAYCDELDEEVKMIGAANTLINKEGQLYAYNTDYQGLKEALEHSKISLKDKVVMILGTGGTSKTIQYLCKSWMAKEVLVVSRTPSKDFISYPEANHRKNVEVLINATPVGQYPNNTEMPIQLDAFKHLEAVIDVIYNPLKTQLILAAEKRGLKTSTGLRMLVSQALFAAEKFSQKTIDYALMDTLEKRLRKENTNLVLIGMPSSGKSTIGKALQLETQRKWIDIDHRIEEKTQRKISDIFLNDGEAYFRKLEKETLYECSKERGIILSTGGGSILDQDNVLALKQNGILVFLNRDLNQLKIEAHRPLAQDQDALRQLYLTRVPLYMNAADLIIDNNQDIPLAIAEIQEKFNEMFSD